MVLRSQLASEYFVIAGSNFFSWSASSKRSGGEGGRRGFQPTHTINNTGPLQHSQQIQHDSLLFLLVMLNDIYSLMCYTFLFFSKKHYVVLNNNLNSNGNYVKKIARK